MLNLISYWGVITLCVLTLVLIIAPYFFLLANHACKVISNGDLGDYRASNYFLTRFKLKEALGKSVCGGLYYRFNDAIQALVSLVGFFIGAVLLITYGAGKYDSLISLAHSIAMSTHESVAFLFIGILMYLAVIKVGRVMYSLGTKLAKLEESSDD